MKETTPAVAIRHFHRWSGFALILLVAIKIISGFRLSGAFGFPGEAAANRMHFSGWVDVPLLFFFIFHSTYGILKVWMSRGSSRKARAFVIANIAAFFIFLSFLALAY